MLAYLICFGFTPLNTFLASYFFRKNNKKIAYLFSFFAIFIPAFIAGVRSLDVGVDINVYVEPIFKRALTMDISSYLKYNSLEIGYLLFVYIIAKIFKNIYVLLFFIEFIVCAGVYYFAYHYRDEIPMCLTVFSFLCIWYFKSYSLMRQSIAMAIILFSIVQLEKRNYIKTIMLFFLAYSFHKTTIFAIVIYCVIYIQNSKVINYRAKIISYLVMFIMSFIILLSYEWFINTLVYEYQLFPERFAVYLKDEEFVNSSYIITKTEILIRVVIFVLGILYLSYLNNKKIKDANFGKYFVIFILSIFPYILSMKISNVDRVGFWFFYISIMYLMPCYLKLVKKDHLNQIIFSIILMGVLFYHWIWKYPINKGSNVYPYKSDIITFLNII